MFRNQHRSPGYGTPPSLPSKTGLSKTKDLPLGVNLKTGARVREYADTPPGCLCHGLVYFFSIPSTSVFLSSTRTGCLCQKTFNRMTPMSRMSQDAGVEDYHNSPAYFNQATPDTHPTRERDPGSLQGPVAGMRAPKHNSDNQGADRTCKLILSFIFRLLQDVGKRHRALTRPHPASINCSRTAACW